MLGSPILFLLIIVSRASALSSNPVSLLLKLSEVQLKIGKVDDCVSTAKACLHSDPEHSKCLKLFKKLKKLSKSIEKVEQYVESKKYSKALTGLGVDPVSEDATSALAILTDLKMDGTIKFRVYSLAAECYLQLKKAGEAIQFCDRALALDPNNVETLCRRADAFILKEEFDAGLTRALSYLILPFSLHVRCSQSRFEQGA